MEKKPDSKSNSKLTTFEEIGEIFEKYKDKNLNIEINKLKIQNELCQLFITKKYKDIEFPKNENYNIKSFKNSLIMECLTRDYGKYIFNKEKFKIIYDCLKSFYKNNGYINRQDKIFEAKNTLLILMIKKGYYDIALDMLDYFPKLDLKKADYQGNTALHTACFLYGLNSIETESLQILINKLIEKGASLTEKNNLAKTGGEFSKFCTPYKLLTTNFNDVELFKKVKFKVDFGDKKQKLSVLIKQDKSNAEDYEKYVEDNEFFSLCELKEKGFLKENNFKYKYFDKFYLNINSFAKDLALERIVFFSSVLHNTPYGFLRDITHHRNINIKGCEYKNKEKILNNNKNKDFIERIKKKYDMQKKLYNEHQENLEKLKQMQKNGRNILGVSLNLCQN
jgi:hypothetical protein